MRPKDCAYIVERLAIRFMALVADHERQLSEHRTSFGARTEADAKIIARLRSEVEASEGECNVLRPLVVDAANQVQDMREEIIRVNEAHGRTKVEHDGLLDELAVQRDAFTANVERIRRELCEGRDALRAEVAALQERLRASIARGDFAQMEVAALKSQTPKHPVKVGEWVRRTKKCAHFGHVAKVLAFIEPCSYEVQCIEGRGIWYFHNCEPCDPPQTAPVPKRAHPVAVGGYLRRLTGFNTTPAGEVARVTLVDGDESSQLEYEVVRPNGQKGRWSAKGCEPCDPPEATHDTPAGTESAESAVRTEPVAEEIKVGDLVEVVSNTGRNTWLADVGSLGTVTSIETLEDSLSVRLKDVPDKKNVCGGYVSICDVRKVTT